MLDDYGLRLLAEIGVDVYVPRTSSAVAPSASAAAHVATPAEAAVVVVAGTSAARERLVETIEYALRTVGLEPRRDDGTNDDALAAAAAVLALGSDRARAVGARLTAQRQGELEWVVAAAVDELACDPAAKRALWGEIKRLARTCAAGRAPAGA